MSDWPGPRGLSGSPHEGRGRGQADLSGDMALRIEKAFGVRAVKLAKLHLRVIEPPFTAVLPPAFNPGPLFGAPR
jgi:hypothetical protein